MSMFDRYVIVDWSASSVPRRRRDSVWVGDLGADGRHVAHNPTTRRAAEALVGNLLADAVVAGERVLVGFDFPYAYPAGFATALGLEGPAWRAVWRLLSSLLRDEADNRNNRFDVAASINARLGHHAFWGCPQALDGLSSRMDVARYHVDAESLDLLAQWREVEVALHGSGRRPQSAWKLYGNGSVGSQALTGIPVVARLRDDARLAAVSRVWPFEVGVPVTEPGRAAIVHAEIWPSLVQFSADDGMVRDEAQVVTLARHFRTLDITRELGALFAAPMSSPLAAEEGWILGVPAPATAHSSVA
jgi:hypothetical protein